MIIRLIHQQVFPQLVQLVQIQQMIMMVSKQSIILYFLFNYYIILKGRNLIFILNISQFKIEKKKKSIS